MPVDIDKLDSLTHSLKEDWSFLEPLRVPIDTIRDRSAVFVREIKRNGGETKAYVKIYANKKHPMQRIFRKGRGQNEVRNLLYFQSVGISTPEIITWGERRNAIGRIVEEFIITAAEKDTSQLDVFVAQHCADSKQSDQQAIRLHIANQLGKWTAAMHAGNFIHEDLKWRNILARPNGTQPELFWIDCPKGHFKKPGKDLDRKKLKDCATLDKLARIQCSKEERSEFTKAYLGCETTPSQVQELCSDIEKYRRQRFDAKDDQQRKDAKEDK